MSAPRTNVAACIVRSGTTCPTASVSTGTKPRNSPSVPCSFNVDPTVARSLRREEERQPLGVVVDWNLQHEVRLPVDREVRRDDADAKPCWKCLAGLRVGVVNDFHRFSRPLDSRWLATRGPVFQAESRREPGNRTWITNRPVGQPRPGWASRSRLAATMRSMPRGRPCRTWRRAARIPQVLGPRYLQPFRSDRRLIAHRSNHDTVNAALTTALTTDGRRRGRRIRHEPPRYAASAPKADHPCQRVKERRPDA